MWDFFGNLFRKPKALRDHTVNKRDSSDAEDVADSFFDTLHNCLEKSRFQKTPHQFLPVDTIERVFTIGDTATNVTGNASQEIWKLLELKSATDRDAALVDFILSRARRVFLICLQSRQRHIHMKMIMFMKHGFDDDQLPVKEIPSTDIKVLDNEHPFSTINSAYRDKEHRELWRVRDIDAFCRDQFMFLAPILSTTKVLHDFGRRTLPFISVGSSSRQGTFGTVEKYEVHPAHFEDHGQERKTAQRVIAVKQFKYNNRGGINQWEKEIRILGKVNAIGHDHIVRFLTAFRHGEGPHLDHFICFEWADGGNLADLWEDNPQPILSATLIRAVIQQLLGLAQALRLTHYFTSQERSLQTDPEETFIHGDIKPKNILRFGNMGGVGILKLADWGEARVYGADTAYDTNTQLRHNTTETFGTRRYEPPEVETGLVIDELEGTKNIRSRLYDTWSFGCISLEFIIWLLHGKEGLTKFHRDDVGDYGLSDSFYEVNHERLGKVHGVVNHWMDHLQEDPACLTGTSALGDLLDIVRHGLLVVKLPQGGGSIDTRVKTFSRFTFSTSEKLKEEQIEASLTSPITRPLSQGDIEDPDDGPSPPSFSDKLESTDQSMHTEDESGSEKDASSDEYTVESVNSLERFRAVELVENLARLARVEHSHDYWFRDVPRCPIPPMFRKRASQVLLKVPSRMRGNYHFPDLDQEDWKVGLDNEYAANTFEQLARIGHWSPSQPSKVIAVLCKQCQSFQKEIWSPLFSITYATSLLSQNAKMQNCDLCVLLWQVCKDNVSTRHSQVRFERRDSTVKISDKRFPVLSLFRNYDARSVFTDIQTGFSELPGPGTELHLEVLRGWLDHCDSSHWKDPRCRPSMFKRSAAGSRVKLPTRLIAVSAASENIIKIQDMEGSEGGDWVALSYQWGAPPHFSTTRQNLKEMYAGIDIDILPQTFKDAIKVTRALQRPYLWIDSLCIIQGPGGDFDTEATTMEDVFNGAYCVLAACCAKDQRSGFLSARVPRQRVTLDPQHYDYGAIHVCPTIENFGRHVLAGGLAQRGWVLQEHALARRTIFFTKYQTYWECGHGVRCETMATLSNDHASLLGDPDFPKRLEPVEHGEFVMRLQELLKQYSRLGLSRDYDRPTAIASLQQRLMRVMNLQGEYGAFDSKDNPGLLLRSLLWHRSLDTVSLATITYSKDREVPSWSWMSCSGPIDYFPLTFFGFDWQPLEAIWSDAKSTGKKTRLSATVQNMNLSAANPFEADIIFDVPAKVDEKKVMAVVLGVEKGDIARGDKKHYILAVTSKEAWGHALYARVGSGHVPGRCLVGQPESCSLI